MSTQNRIHSDNTIKNGTTITEAEYLKWFSFIYLFFVEILYDIIKNKTKKTKCYFVRINNLKLQFENLKV